MIKCPNCNAELRDEALICSHCGTVIEKSERYAQPKTEDIMNIDVFEEEEAEEEREESLKIVDGFYKSNKKREQVQKVLDQACDELRKNGVILVSSGAATVDDAVEEFEEAESGAEVKAGVVTEAEAGAAAVTEAEAETEEYTTAIAEKIEEIDEIEEGALGDGRVAEDLESDLEKV